MSVECNKKYNGRLAYLGIAPKRSIKPGLLQMNYLKKKIREMPEDPDKQRFTVGESFLKWKQ